MQEGLYLRWQWSQASGALASRSTGIAEVLRLGSDGLLSAKKKQTYGLS